MKTDERKIGKQAAEMLTRSLQHSVSGFKAHVTKSDEEEKKHLSDAHGAYKTKRYGDRKSGTQHWLRTISIKMEKHGFVQHYGVDSLREGGYRTRKKPKETTYGFKAHAMNLPAKPFIHKAIENSGIVSFVMEEVMKSRSQKIMLNMKQFLEE